ncbi:RING-H2 finger protein ATL57 [Malania oleifera]|uniref:RING-H2 finger protein ATL57 n=1 Tax=Malania oleifera TaxID=397392 RepID=UPI0025ADC45C|nr:RING-H2 finger protein ATL57 [Malania oleifera]XP_057956047.1 RING-H2 finger protein ATL57 [Malania oleifera]XP_057956048.1 RING-H2 finger protein ATL57 [Malania oleifera]XP_057956049.1 RING-H2 finger protein ATL57 [Malania oleifera]
MKPRNRKILLHNDDASGTSREPPPRSSSDSPPPLLHQYPTNNASYSPLMIKKTPTPPTTDTNTVPFDSSMALTVFVLLVALFFMGFFSIYIRRFADPSSVDLSRRRHPRQPPSSSSSSSLPPPHSAVPRKGGLHPCAVRSLPLFTYAADADDDPGECAVCLGEFHVKETIKVIPFCRHVFHPLCIDTWLSSHASCPLCRTTRLFPTKEGVGSGGGGLDALDGEGNLSASELGRRSAAESDDTRMEMATGGMRRTISF